MEVPMRWHSLRALRRNGLALAVLLSLACRSAAYADTQAPPASEAPAARPATPPAAAPADAAPTAPAKAFSVKTDAQAAPAPDQAPSARPASPKPAAPKPAAKPAATPKPVAVAKPAAPVAPEPDPGQVYIKPFPGSRQTARSSRNYDDYWMALGKLHGESQADKVELLGGRWTHAGYLTSAGPSVAEVFRHYEAQVTKAGLEVVYSCKGTECGEGGRKTNGDWWWLSDNRAYLAARLARPNGDLWVAVHVYAKTPKSAVEHEIDVIEVRPPAVPPPVRNEAEVATLAKDLKSDGRVVLRQIGFMNGRANVLPESEPVVKAIADLLARDPSLKFYLVAHSDDTGSWSANVDLTKKRANAVVSILTRKFGVRPGRVQPAGVGPLSPIASNANDEGRALNCRIELVPQGGGKAGGPAAARR
jgi:OOP family OmpA-OmpF porin